MYYSVVAYNGFGVYDNQRRLENAKEWMIKPIVEEFTEFIEAKINALDIYNDYHNAYDDLDYYYDTDRYPDIKTNWFYSKSYIKKMNMA